MSSIKVLIIEDDFEALTMYALMLERWGYQVIRAQNGAEGIQQALQNPPDLILLDVMMPGMDGYAVCTQLRQDRRFQTVPILFLTAVANVDARVKALTIGGDDFMVKSAISSEELQARIKMALAREKRIRHSAAVEAKGVTVGLLSLRGGSGVSTLAMNLAFHSARYSQQPTTLIDLSLPIGNIGAWAGVSGTRHIIELASRPPTEISSAVIKQFSLQHIGDFSFISAPSQITDVHTVDPRSLRLIPSMLRDEGAFVVLDLGRGELPLYWGIPTVCDWLVIVATEDSLSQHLAGVALEGLPKMLGNNSSLLLLYNHRDAGAMRQALTGLPRKPDVEIPFSPNLASLPAPSPVIDLWEAVRFRLGQRPDWYV